MSEGSSDPGAATTVNESRELAATVAVEDSLAGKTGPGTVSGLPSTSVGARTTVLPRLDLAGPEPKIVPEHRPRFETVTVLGAGGVGEVALVKDNDIERQVALKRLLPEMTSPAMLARFAEEIRTIGQLEHPNIPPIHDVGVDDQGRLFYVMKYVDGETLESIIAKLDAGDAEYQRRFTFERRVQVFLGLLRAVQYAHARGIIHRDIKPANVMVGRFGEVMLMDWGLARPLNGSRSVPSSPEEDPARGPSRGPDKASARLRTRHGALLGTPMYMSPEQARGASDTLDQRSDLYSLCVLFHEFLTLNHYLAGKSTLEATLLGVIEETPTFAAWQLHPHQSRVPAELAHFLKFGLEKDPSERFQDVDTMIARLQANAEGLYDVRCAMTVGKRIAGEFQRFVNRSPYIALAAFIAAAVLLLFGLVTVVRSALYAVVPS